MSIDFLALEAEFPEETARATELIKQQQLELQRIQLDCLERCSDELAATRMHRPQHHRQVIYIYVIVQNTCII